MNHEKSKIPKFQNPKNPFFQNFFGKVKNGHKKVCPNFEIAKSFRKKIFFLSSQTEKLFFENESVF